MTYKCMKCGKENDASDLKRRIRCIYCGHRILYKPRTVTKTVKAV
jgi:DNA-directed RNA polymerase subunit RPC12/RpoP